MIHVTLYKSILDPFSPSWLLHTASTKKREQQQKTIIDSSFNWANIDQFANSES